MSDVNQSQKGHDEGDDSNDESYTGSHVVLDVLAEEGVTELFGLVGEGNSYLMDIVTERGLPFNSARHEQVAVGMADGYARTTGNVGVCTVTHGPGLTHAATGIAIADRDNVPLVVVIGDTDRTAQKTSLQYLDHQTVTRPMTVHRDRVETPEGLADDLRLAFKEARLHSGPAILELPFDIQSGAAPELEYTPAPRFPQRPSPDPERLTEAAALLDDADNPVILAGGGASKSGAGDAVASLAEHVGAPIATTFYAKGFLPETHPMVSGIAGTFMTPANHELLWDADVVLAVGALFSRKTTRHGELYEDADVVQIDIDERALGTHRDPTVGIVSDATAAVDALRAETTADPDRADAVRTTIADAGMVPEVEYESPGDLIDPREVVSLVSDIVPENSLVTVDSGNNTGFPAVYHTFGDRSQMLVNGNFGSMGFSLPAGLGATIGLQDLANSDPDRHDTPSDRPVVSYVGDGSLMQVLQDIETAVRLELPLIVVILNDSSYGIIRHRQQKDYGRTTGSEFESPDFVQIAEGLGSDAALVTDASDLSVLEEYVAGDADGPLVLDARTNPEIARPGFPPF